MNTRTTTIGKGISLLATDPGLFLRKLRCRWAPRWLLPRSPVRRSIGGVVFDLDLDLDRDMRAMYFDLYEPDIVRQMRRILKPGDIFIDVGANIGYLSVIGAGCVGVSGQVHSFEPVPQYAERLRRMAEANAQYAIVVNACALGDEPGTGTIDVTCLDVIGWNTMVPHYMPGETLGDRRTVPVRRLDDYIFENHLERIALIKIDTEGYELPVLRGLSRYFEGTPCRPAILCEVAPSAYPLLGCSLADLAQYMGGYGYRARSVSDPGAEVRLTELADTIDVLFVGPD